MKQFIHGRHAVREALLARHPLERIYFAEDVKGEAIEEIKRLARERSVRFDFVPLAKVSSLTRSREHQGVAAVVGAVAYELLSDFLEKRAGQERLLLVALDQIQNPRNVGLIARTAAGAGAAGILVCARGGAIVDEQVVRASAGTIYRIPLIKVTNLAQTLRTLKRDGFWNYGLSADGPMEVGDISWPQRVTLVIGNEHKGMRRLVRDNCDVLVRIGITGGLDSFNAAVAAGIALYHVYRYRGPRGQHASDSAISR
jgi:23S rRNA (guanosine2251-2'-O)-methyltransferase